METINPNDIAKLYSDDISFITLKNGNKLKVDISAPEKYDKKTNEPKNKFVNNYNKSQKFVISTINAISFGEKDNFNNIKFGSINSRYKDIKETKILKNDFNLVSYISKNTNFSFKPNKNNKNITNNLPNYQLNKEEEKIDFGMKIKRPIYLDKMERLFDENSQQKTNPAITLNILSDLNKHLNTTQKEFNSLVNQFKRKKNKYSPNKKDRSIYQRYYESYKNNESNIIKQIKMNLNKIKHYKVPDKEETDKNKENDVQDKNKFNRNNLNCNNNFNFRTIDSDFNSRTSINSFHKYKSRNSSERKMINYKLGGGLFGYSSTLICPSNIFKSKLDMNF